MLYYLISFNFKARKFGMRFVWILLEGLRIFLGFGFCPHSLSPSLEIRITPPPPQSHPHPPPAGHNWTFKKSSNRLWNSLDIR